MTLIYYDLQHYFVGSNNNAVIILVASVKV